MTNAIKTKIRNSEKAINEASGYNDTTNKILDCITNLQEELKAKDIIIGWKNERIDKLTNKLIKRTDRIAKATEYMKHYIKVENAPINNRIKIEFLYVMGILKGENEK